jgi:hypothetical protein
MCNLLVNHILDRDVYGVSLPIGEGLSIAFWASRLSEKLFSRKLTLSNLKLSFELKKNNENDRNIDELPAKLRSGT